MNLETELSYTASRSSGPGGQNVNKVNTRITLHFDVMNSLILNSHQKQVILDKLQNRINKEGQLVIACEETRSQLRNKELAIELLHQLINQALKPIIKRKATKPTHSSKLKRLKDKKNHANKKVNRRKPDY
ncbi:alternative ribosome rescue aminoacyl-tRNA hydrolase ArfB [Saccharicrinis fermentans]|uniref:Peptidyl-tRNA hydrolase YaeJ n=1 Tax=Saccharicrinis fermentans DSM 9555 = JCM 21142 TaxID=869213 RepID=W7YRR8_9BACT|nr:alternative ribosome rescue aminoacyl-tRNA hydrolase ArfB [Saccharicrinis fermentans]GAF05114.1 peptidyl-tRNA hydrolase YaeJ [Saccharicrinis fermentans DSM 9555 = JCM 21142]